MNKCPTCKYYKHCERSGDIHKHCPNVDYINNGCVDESKEVLIPTPEYSDCEWPETYTIREWIVRMFFHEHMGKKDIAKELCVSNRWVRKCVEDGEKLIISSLREKNEKKR